MPVVPRARARAVPLLAALMLGAGLPAGALAQAGDPEFPGLSDTPPPFEGGEGEEPAGGDDPARGGDASGGGDRSGDGDPSGGGQGPAGEDRSEGDELSEEVDELPRSGSEAILLGLTGAALALIGTGLRLRTLDAELF